MQNMQGAKYRRGLLAVRGGSKTCSERTNMSAASGLKSKDGESPHVELGAVAEPTAYEDDESESDAAPSAVPAKTDAPAVEAKNPWLLACAAR